MDLGTLEPENAGQWHPVAQRLSGRSYRQCANGTQHGVCNWMVPAAGIDSFCAACRLNDVIPNLEAQANLERWRGQEIAKRRLLYTIFQLGLPVDAVPKRIARPCGSNSSPILRRESPPRPVTRTASSPSTPPRRTMPKGNAAGSMFHEPMRTLLGHVHEVGHYYWDRLVANSGWLERFRVLFGDDRQDYASALNAYYQSGPPADWQSRFISAYASSHPWEDSGRNVGSLFPYVRYHRNQRPAFSDKPEAAPSRGEDHDRRFRECE